MTTTTNRKWIPWQQISKGKIRDGERSNKNKNQVWKHEGERVREREQKMTGKNAVAFTFGLIRVHKQKSFEQRRALFSSIWDIFFSDPSHFPSIYAVVGCNGCCRCSRSCGRNWNKLWHRPNKVIKNAEMNDTNDGTQSRNCMHTHSSDTPTTTWRVAFFGCMFAPHNSHFSHQLHRHLHGATGMSVCNTVICLQISLAKFW